MAPGCGSVWIGRSFLPCPAPAHAPEKTGCESEGRGGTKTQDSE
jgi:hypothetical protein